MKYHVWQAQADLMAHMRLYTEATAQAMRQPWLAELPAARRVVPYQPKPAPTPTDFSSPLSAPPKVTVARSLIARW